MSQKIITAPGGFVPLIAVGFGGEEAASTAVTAATPLPVLDPPATRSRAIAPDDAATFPATRSILVVSGGDVTLRLAGDDADTRWPGLPAMTELRMAVVAVRAAGTTATQIRGLY